MGISTCTQRNKGRCKRGKRANWIGPLLTDICFIMDNCKIHKSEEKFLCIEKDIELKFLPT